SLSAGSLELPEFSGLFIELFIPEKSFPILLPDRPQYAARTSHSHHIGGNILRHNASGTNHRIFSDGHSRQNHHVGPNPNVPLDMNLLIILNTVFPKLRQHRMTRGGDGHIGSEHHSITDINLSVIHHCEIKIGIYPVPHM